MNLETAGGTGGGVQKSTQNQKTTGGTGGGVYFNLQYLQ
jgi:hypothetical protein